MLIPSHFIPGLSGILDEEEIEKCMENTELTERLRRSLYYGKLPTTDRPSLPVTEIAVEFFQDAAPRELGRVDTFIASSYGRRACMSPCAMMLGMLYIERLKKRNPEYLRHVSSSDLFLISMMMASKYLYDEGVDEEVFNDEWAESAGLDLQQLNELERGFLGAIDWQLFVQPEDFWRMLREVERRIAWVKGQQHGSYIYSDLVVLTENSALVKTIQTLLLELSKVVLVCCVAYVAGVLTVLGSTASVLYARQQLPGAERIVLPALPAWCDRLTDSLHSWTGLGLTDPLNTWTGPGLAVSTAAAPPKTSTQRHTSSTRENATSDPDANQSTNPAENETEIPRIPFSPPHAKSSRSRRKLSESSGPLRLPGFLTLVMLKDTVFSFASSVVSTLSIGDAHSTTQNGNGENGHSDMDMKTDPEPEQRGNQDNSVQDDVTCTCGCCGPDFGHDKLCYNLTQTRIPLHGLPLHSEMDKNNDARGRVKFDRGKMNWPAGSPDTQTDCPLDLTRCACCCAVPRAEWVVPGEQRGDPGSRTRSPAWHGVPEPTRTPAWQRDPPAWQRVEEPFAGMTFGFSTSVVAAAG